MATTVTDRVKNLLSSFISDVEKNKNYDKSKRPADADSSEPVTTCSRNKMAYYDRVETYSALTWFAKPYDLSPLVCARYGWKNTDTDMLQCVNCKAFLSGQLPAAVDTQLYKESCDKLKKWLIESHEKLCTWSTNPCPESFSRVPYENQEELERDFRNRLTTFQDTHTSLPAVSHTTLQQQMITEDKLQILMEDIQRQTNLPDIHTVSTDAILFSLCGWAYSEGQVSVLQCSCCRRRVGLWNYSVTTDNRSDKSPDKTHDSTEDDTPEPAKKRAKIDKQSFDPVAEHRYWCPWIQPSAMPLVGHTSVPDPGGLQASGSDMSIPAWLLVMRILSHSGDKEADFCSHMKRSPQLESLKHLRRVLRDCTSKTSPTKSPTDRRQQETSPR